jgi:hypothetical protein
VKEVMSLCTFGIVALCFVVFVMVFKPDALSAVPAPSKCKHCKIEASPAHRRSLQIFAATSGGRAWPWQ